MNERADLAKWVVSVEVDSVLFSSRMIELCGVFDSNLEAVEFRLDRATKDGRDIMDYRITEVAYRPKVLLE